MKISAILFVPLLAVALAAGCGEPISTKAQAKDLAKRLNDAKKQRAILVKVEGPTQRKTLEAFLEENAEWEIQQIAGDKWGVSCWLRRNEK